ncbi:hypothetical protein AAHE18_16G145000 [Arachis hypogaea]
MMAIYLLLEILGPSKLFAASHFLNRGCLPYYIRSTLRQQIRQLLEKRTKKELLLLQLLFKDHGRCQITIADLEHVMHTMQ